MKLQKAEQAQLPLAAALYKEAIGREGCTWDEEYPGEFWLNKDFETGNLYVFSDEDENVVGAVSVVCENELDVSADWTEKENAREIARVVIGKEHTGKGLAKEMLSLLFQFLASSGVKAIHLSVAASNPPALRTYRKLGFSFLTECDMYGHHFFLCEKIL